MGLLSFIRQIFSGVSAGTNGSGRDKTLRCVQCNKDFVFEAGEQEFFQEKGFQEPKRCPECRKQHKPGSRGSRGRRRRR